MRFTDPIVLLFFALGLTFGSFTNVLIFRLPDRKRLTGRSHCPQCEKKLQPCDMIPVVSFFLLRGRCRHCGWRIPFHYPLVELAVGILFVIALFLIPANSPVALLLAFVLWLLFAIAAIDAKTQGVPDVLSIPFLIIAIIYGALTDSITLMAPLIAAGFFLAQWVISSGKWVGSGDIILAAGIGFLLGDWQSAVLAIAISYIIGAAVASFLLITGRKTRQDHVAFGPFLAIGTILTLLMGEQLLFVLVG